MRFIFVTCLLLLTPALAAADCCCDPCCEIFTAEAEAELATVVFHLPLAFNDGTPVPGPQLEALLADVVDIAGGFTYYEATGGWMHEGRLYREPVWVVKVGLEEREVEEFIGMIEERLKTEFRQEAVWVEESGSAEIL
jgi:hypothetical protein